LKRVNVLTNIEKKKDSAKRFQDLSCFILFIYYSFSVIVLFIFGFYFSYVLFVVYF